VSARLQHLLDTAENLDSQLCELIELRQQVENLSGKIEKNKTRAWPISLHQRVIRPSRGRAAGFAVIQRRQKPGGSR